MRIILPVICFLIISIPSAALSENFTTTQENVAAAIKILRPDVSDSRAIRLSKHIWLYSNESKIDPLLTTAIIHRESRFSFAVETGVKKGSLPQKCVGLMQIYPFGAAHKLSGFCNLSEAGCNIYTGTRWLGHLKTTCGATVWQWVASYGMSSCPSYMKARKNYAAVLAREFYCTIREDCHLSWPLQEL